MISCPNRGSRLLKDCYTLLQGIALGVVELIPGISAGTIALILGIYENLIGAIASLTNLCQCLLLPWRNRHCSWKNQISTAWNSVPWRFVLMLFLGMGGAPLLFSHLVGSLLETAPQLSMAFFCGIIPVAVVLPLRAVKSWHLVHIVTLLLTVTSTILLLGLPMKVSEEPTLWFLALSGAIAAAVMVLPGVSGSFVLLVLGPYPYIIDLIRSLTRGTPQLLPLIVFQFGVFIGIAAVSKLVAWLLRHAKGTVLAALSGLMIGSLRRLWPFVSSSAKDGTEPFSFYFAPKIPITEILHVSTGEMIPILIAFLSGATLATVGVVGALRVRHLY